MPQADCRLAALARQGIMIGTRQIQEHRPGPGSRTRAVVATSARRDRQLLSGLLERGAACQSSLCVLRRRGMSARPRAASFPAQARAARCTPRLASAARVRSARADPPVPDRSAAPGAGFLRPHRGAPASRDTSAFATSSSAWSGQELVAGISAAASSASRPAAGNWPSWASSFARGHPPQGLGVDVIGRGERLGFLGQRLRLGRIALARRAPRRGRRRRSHRYPRSPMARSASQPPQLPLGCGGVSGDQLDLAGQRAQTTAQSSLAPKPVHIDWLRAIAARASANRPA